MIASLLLDLDDAPDFPGATGQALGRPLAAYPFIAARATGAVRRYYVVTSSQPVKAVALQNGAVIIDPPAASNGVQTPAEAFLRHGFKFALEDAKSDKETIDILMVFFANAPAITGDVLQQGLDALQAKPELDSAVTVSPFNRLKPSCARRVGENGLLEPYATVVPGAGDVWYPDYAAQLLRPRCLEGACAGQAPFPWLGRKILPLKMWGVGPIDFQWQIPSLEYWLKKHGFADLSASLELQPQPKLQPKSERR